ncbi:hypothetical protein LLH23_10745 [bacterium]|nr:hypothetical protein [bacterium]
MRVPLMLLALVITALAHAAPVVWQVQDPVQPGDTVMLFGDGFGEKPQVELCRLGDGPASTPGQPVAGSYPHGAGVTVLQASDQCLKVLIAPNQKPGLYSLLVGNTPVLVNRPTLWWAQTEGVSPGQVLRLFGKNLAGPKAQVFLRGPKSVSLFLGKWGDTWAARVAVPAKLPPGHYEAFYHCGYGGPRGWSAPLPLIIPERKPWPIASFSVRDFGADGTGARDDTAAIQAALDKAGANGGGFVMLPRGRYQVTAGLRIPRFVRLLGEPLESVALFWPDMTNPPEALIQGTNSFAIANLTLYASKARHIIVGDLGDKPDAGNVELACVRTRVDAYRGHLTAEETDLRHRDLARISGGDSVRLGGDNLRILNCDLYGSGRALFLSRARNSVVQGNALYNGRHGWYCLSGSDGLIFENNTITGADLMATGGGLNCLDGSSASQNVYYAHNTLRLMHGWDREAMTSDAGGGLYYGPIARAKGTALTLPEALKPGARNWADAAVFVFSGKGWTQMRRVVKVEGDTVTVDRPWDVPPDATSLVGITMLQRHYILSGNSFSDAGIAIQFYGSSSEHIVSGNTCARAGGYQGIGKPYGGYTLPPDKNPCHQPSWFCQYVDNAITEGSIYRSGANNAILSGDSVIGLYGWPLTRDWPWPYNVGSVVRGNRLDNNARIHVGGSGNDRPSVSDAVIEDNTIRDAEEAVRLDRAIRGIVVRGNTVENVRDPLTGDGLERGLCDGAQWAAAERSRLRVAAREAGRTDDPATWPEVAQTLTALEQAPAAATREASLGVLTAFFREADNRGVVLPHATAARLVGFSLQVNKVSTLPALLQKGGGGEATLVLDLSLARWQPGWQIAAHVAEPLTCARDGSATALQDGRASLTLPVTVPPGTWGRRQVCLHVGVILPHTQVWLSPTLTVGSGQIRDWLVVGPFPNESGQPLDLTLYPPEDALNIHADVDGRKWQPVKLGNEWLDLGALLKTKEPGVAYAVACLNAATETPAVLQVGSSGGLTVVLNGGYVWSANQSRNAAPAQDRVPLTLRAGDNVLLIKTCTNTNQWRLTAELTPMGASFPAAVAVVPADQFANREAFATPKPRSAPQAGEIRYPAGANWQLAYGDDFTGQALSGRWREAVGKWTAHDGFVQSSGDKAFLAYAEKLPAPVRVEYDTRVIGGAGGDLSPFWLTDPTNYGSGYLFGFGSNGNTCNKLLVDGAEVLTSPRPLVTPGKWHHVIAQVLADGHAQLIVDDQLSLDFQGPAPGAPRHPGLWTWGPEGVFAKVRIYRGP